MKKKIITVVSVILAAVVLFAAYKVFLAPKGTEGSNR